MLVLGAGPPPAPHKLWQVLRCQLERIALAKSSGCEGPALGKQGPAAMRRQKTVLNRRPQRAHAFGEKPLLLT
jgi:hypothetical protein